MAQAASIASSHSQDQQSVSIPVQDGIPSPSRMDSLRERMNKISAAAAEQPAAPIMSAATERTNTSHMTGTMEALQQRMFMLRKKQEP